MHRSTSASIVTAIAVWLVLLPAVAGAAQFSATTSVFLDNSAGPCTGSLSAGPSSSPVAADRTCGPGAGQLSVDAVANGGSLGVRSSAISTSVFSVGGGGAARFTESLIFSGATGVIPISLNLALSGDAAVGVAGGGLVQYSVRIDGAINGSVFFEELGVNVTASGHTVSHFGNLNVIGVPNESDATFNTVASTPVVFVDPSVPVSLELSFGVSTNVGNGSPGSSVTANFLTTLGFPEGIPVFNVPDGVTVDAPALNLIDNRFIVPTNGAVPEPTTVALLGLGSALLLVAVRGRRPV